jgi:hypothetical protein
METAIMESSIMSYSANPETPIMETAIKESPIKSTQENRKSGERLEFVLDLMRLYLFNGIGLSYQLKHLLDMIEPY